MNIALYYIEGISRRDEPCFQSITAQNVFFDAHKIATLDAGFYPPHYQNRIRVSITDVTFDTSCNYLALLDYEGDNTNYYYFIDSIRYVSESVIELFITMDTIQTFMFNIQVNNAVLDRHTISRWNDSVINRDYIRENMSKGHMIPQSYYLENDNDHGTYSIGTIIIRLAKNAGWSRRLLFNGTDTATINPAILEQEQQGSEYITETQFLGEIILMIPYVRKYSPRYQNSNITITWNESSSAGTVTHTCDMTTLPITDSAVIGIHYVDYDAIPCPHTWSIVNNQAKLTCTNAYTGLLTTAKPCECLDGSGSFAGYYFVCNSVSTKSLHNQVSLLSLTKNTSKTAQRSSIYVPAMLDENYMTFKYGERLGYTSAPLHLLSSSTVYLNAQRNPVSGNRTYWVSGGGLDGAYTDRNLTTIINQTQETIELFNSAWSSYLSQNRATLTRGRALAQQKALVGFAQDTISNVANLYSGSGTLGQRAVTSAANEINSGIGTIFTAYSIDEELGITKENLQYTPDTVKQGNIFFDDVVANSLELIMTIDKVEDFESVAHKYEMYGYKVHQVLSNPDFFNGSLFNIRYYYNVIKTATMDINITGRIGTTAECDDIINRFNMGIRLWNTDTSGTLYASKIGSYQYDNVEKSFIEE